MEDEDICVGIILAAYLLESSNEDDVQEDEVPEVKEQEEELPRKKRRTVWQRNWVKRREQEGFCQKLYSELRAEEPQQQLLYNFLRITADQFDNLLALVTPLIKKEDTVMRESITASDRLILTLRFLATGDSYRSLQQLFRIPHNTISTIIPAVLDAIYKVLVDEYLKTPTSPEAWQAVACKYDELWQFPHCIGAVDGKHVVMVAPPHAGTISHNYKGTHSVVLMGIADAEYKLLYVDVGRNGRFSDDQLLGLPAPEPLPCRELPIPYVLVADDAFALRPNIMKPYSSQRGDLTMVQRVYNYRLSRARHTIENVFGIMSARFRVLRKPVHLNPEKTKKVTLACCVMHNYLLTTDKRKYAPTGTFDQYDERNGDLIPGDWRQEAIASTMYPLEGQTHPENPSTSAKDVQKELTEYFVEEGEDDWQYKML